MDNSEFHARRTMDRLRRFFETTASSEERNVTTASGSGRPLTRAQTQREALARARPLPLDGDGIFTKPTVPDRGAKHKLLLSPTKNEAAAAAGEGLKRTRLATAAAGRGVAHVDLGEHRLTATRATTTFGSATSSRGILTPAKISNCQPVSL